MKRLAAAMGVCLLAVSVWSELQPLPQAASRLQVSGARAADVGSIDAVIHALYQVISGPRGEKRDWERFRSLFLPGARLIPAVAQAGDKPVARVLDVEAYIGRAEAFFAREGFWESETQRKLEISGNLAHAFSAYESRREAGGAPFQTGVNSIQLFHDGARWWIVTVMWNSPR